MEKILEFLTAKTEDVIYKIENELLGFENESLLFSYKYMIDYFENTSKKIKLENMVVGVHYVYGFMPTIFHFKSIDVSKLETALDTINFFKNSDTIDHKDIEKLEILKELFNNSIVGTSKLLHFINPDTFAIWDSRVHQQIRKIMPDSGIGYEINNVKNYVKYLELLHELKSTDGFKDLIYKPLKNSIKEKFN